MHDDSSNDPNSTLQKRQNMRTGRTHTLVWRASDRMVAPKMAEDPAGEELQALGHSEGGLSPNWNAGLCGT